MFEVHLPLLSEPMLALLALMCCRVVGLLQQYITITLYQHQAITKGVEAATAFLGLVNAANSSSKVRC
jgi:hypothetical protein